MIKPVSIATSSGLYPETQPFDPCEAYPEYGSRPRSQSANHAYDAVRQAFASLGFDATAFGQAEWNPLGHLIAPGNRVFIKPNFVTHEYRKSCRDDGDLFSVITHPSMLRAVADFAAIALKGRGEIIIGDNPCIDANFEALASATHIREVASAVQERFGVSCRVLDLRPLWCDDLANYGFRSKMVKQAGDPLGSTVVNLGSDSLFHDLNPRLFRGVFTDRRETIRHHRGTKHEYDISNSILQSDVYISVPKLKAHHKVGATLNVKGLVGINNSKNYLVHWRIGTPRFGGDEFPDPPSIRDYALLAARHAVLDLLPEKAIVFLKKKLSDTPAKIILAETSLPSFDLHRGAWDGNDTCWRMAADLYNVFVRDAKHVRPKRKYLAVIDGIIGGDGNGPFCPQRVESKSVLVSEDLLCADVAAIRWMGFDVDQVRYATRLMSDVGLSPQDIPVSINGTADTDFFDSKSKHCQFRAPNNWPKLALHASKQYAKVGS